MTTSRAGASPRECERQGCGVNPFVDAARRASYGMPSSTLDLRPPAPAWHLPDTQSSKATSRDPAGWAGSADVPTRNGGGRAGPRRRPVASRRLRVQPGRATMIRDREITVRMTPEAREVVTVYRSHLARYRALQQVPRSTWTDPTPQPAPTLGTRRGLVRSQRRSAAVAPGPRPAAAERGLHHCLVGGGVKPSRDRRVGGTQARSQPRAYDRPCDRPCDRRLPSHPGPAGRGRQIARRHQAGGGAVLRPAGREDSRIRPARVHPQVVQALLQLRCSSDPASGLIDGVRGRDGRCPPGQLPWVTPPMLHTWTIHLPEGPFATHVDGQAVFSQLHASPRPSST
jgi:hypothetical protein